MNHHSRAILITGCSSGMGRHAALHLHRAGHRVFATARRPEALTDLAAQGITVLPLDVTDDASMRAAVSHVEEVHGEVSVLINNAGYGLHGPVEEVTPDDLRHQFETNVFGLVRLTQLVLPGMRRAGDGRIVNVSSMGGRFSPPGGGPYHATKHALEAISDSLRLEVKPFGIDVVVVRPGPTATAFGGTATDTIRVGDTSGPYASFREALGKMYATTFDPGPRTTSAEAAGNVIARAATRTRPRASYNIGAMARLTLAFRRLLPDAVFDAVLRNQFPLPQAPGRPAAL